MKRIHYIHQNLSATIVSADLHVTIAMGSHSYRYNAEDNFQ